MCDDERHVFTLTEDMTPDEVRGHRCECGWMILDYVACPTCGAIRIDQRPAVRVGLN